MDTLREIWPYVETAGPVILAFALGIPFLSLNIYLHTCSLLRAMEKHLNRKHTLEGYTEEQHPVTGLFDIIYGFKPISKFNKEHLEYPEFNDLFRGMIGFRKMYRIVFPLIIGLAAIGIAINEYVIDQ